MDEHSDLKEEKILMTLKILFFSELQKINGDYIK
nr:MAG TPA: hypothetical protein [Caudoviricetes sp.]DAS61550.1 MAG TPA: hypothetical protein [Caudoviricetes sp.]